MKNFLLALVACAMAMMAGCGGDKADDASARQPENVARSFYSAIYAGDSDRVAQTMGLAIGDLDEAQTQALADQMKQCSEWAKTCDVKVVGSTVVSQNDETAVVELKLEASYGTTTARVNLSKQGDDWVVRF